MLKRLLIGRPLTLKQQHQQQVTKKEAIALLSSDALSSVAYGPEQIVIVLALASALSLQFSIIVGCLVVSLLLLLITAYREVITRFPDGGGAYKVTKTYLNETFALATAGLLLVDYILTIAVSVSAGTDAFIAAFPQFGGWYLAFGVGCIIAILLLNLRGVTETAKILMIPVYAFIVAMIIVFVLAALHWNDVHVISKSTITAFSWLIVIKAFAVGCSALTGVEAISNAVPNFKHPNTINARTTLIILGCILALFFSGTLLFAAHYQLTPTLDNTVLSQLVQSVAGRNMFYFLFQALTICLLLFAANTSFAAFPQLLANLAHDGYAPRIFLNRGDRLRLFKQYDCVSCHGNWMLFSI